MTHMHQYGGDCSSSSSLSSRTNGTDDDRMIAVVLSEEYAKLDGAVAKRLSSLPSIPHVPRVNTFIPTLSDASLDHQRLLQRINAYGLVEVKVSGDGNCQFRALSDQLYRSPEYHKHVRKDIVKQLKKNRSLYESYVPMRYKQYYKKMSMISEWGDHVTLQAAADKYELEIFPNLIYRMREPKTLLLIFVLGKVILTGSKSKANILRAFQQICPVLAEFRKAPLPASTQPYTSKNGKDGF